MLKLVNKQGNVVFFVFWEVYPITGDLLGKEGFFLKAYLIIDLWRKEARRKRTLGLSAW